MREKRIVPILKANIRKTFDIVQIEVANHPKLSPADFQNVKDLLELIFVTDEENQREIMFILTTKYRRILSKYYGSFLKAFPFLKNLLQEVITSTIYYNAIVDFNNSGEPIYQRVAKLMPKNENLPKDQAILDQLERINNWNASILYLQKCRLENIDHYEEIKLAFLSEYAYELSDPKNKWLHSYFNLGNLETKLQKLRTFDEENT